MLLLIFPDDKGFLEIRHPEGCVEEPPLVLPKHDGNTWWRRALAAGKQQQMMLTNASRTLQ
jgi:hypothetical protein